MKSYRELNILNKPLPFTLDKGGHYPNPYYNIKTTYFKVIVITEFGSKHVYSNGNNCTVRIQDSSKSYNVIFRTVFFPITFSSNSKFIPKMFSEVLV